MRLFLGILIGLVLAIGIAAAAAYMAFGEISDFGDRDRSADVTQTYDFEGFDQIAVGGVYELDVQVGSDFSVRISGAPEEMARVEAEVEDGVLRLDQEDRNHGVRRWRNLGLTAVVTMPALTGLSVSGVAEADVAGVKAENFSARLSGVGEIDISGTCGALSAHVSGVGELDAADLECADVDVHVSGVGDAKVYASESVYATVSGIGSISVYGSPDRVEKNGGLFADISVR